MNHDTATKAITVEDLERELERFARDTNHLRNGAKHGKFTAHEAAYVLARYLNRLNS